MQQLFRDAVALLGCGLISYGSWLVYEPAGFIVPGILLFAIALVGTLRGSGA